MASHEYYASGGNNAPSSTPPAHGFPGIPPRTTPSPFHGSDYAPSYRTTDPYGNHPVSDLSNTSRADSVAAFHPPAAAAQPHPPYPSGGSPTSPFDSPFDDPIRPLNSAPQYQQQVGSPYYRRDSLYSPPTVSSEYGPPLQQPQPLRTAHPQGPSPYSPDTSYHGAGAGFGNGAASPDDPMADAIPLQDVGKDAEMNDHIYDAPRGGRGGRGGGGGGGDGGGGVGASPTHGSDDAANSRGRRMVHYGELAMFRSSKRKIPWAVYLLSLVQVAVFIAEVAHNGVLTGTPIQVQPSFNWMIGPSAQVLINMGARYVPCMHNLDVVQGSTMAISWPCPNSTTTDSLCSLSELCGFGGVPEPRYDGNIAQTPQPNQWWRFIVPMFMHAGLIHIGFNLFLQLTIGKEMELLIGPVRFFLIYVSAGIFGFVFGGNYAGTAIASTGASGSLFGIMALVLLDLLYSWRERAKPMRDLIFLILEIVVAFVLGLIIPFIDNFAHIGGFIVGLCVGICLLHSPNSLRRRIGPDSTYNTMQGGPEDHDQRPFYRNPVGFFKGRRPLWWVWWLIRAGALVLVIVAFIVLITNFYRGGQTCSWCKYLNCINVNGWCDAANLKVERDPQTTPRFLF